jgi:hypothetical protein
VVEGIGGSGRQGQMRDRGIDILKNTPDFNDGSSAELTADISSLMVAAFAR